MTETVDFRDVGSKDLALVGGKNASLGEMISKLADFGVRVPMGFATTSNAFKNFMQCTGLGDRIAKRLNKVDVTDVVALSAAAAACRSWVLETPLPQALESEIRTRYDGLKAHYGDEHITVAVRSSATAEDLPEASFAGLQVQAAASCCLIRVLHRGRTL